LQCHHASALAALANGRVARPAADASLSRSNITVMTLRTHSTHRNVCQEREEGFGYTAFPPDWSVAQTATLPAHLLLVRRGWVVAGPSPEQQHNAAMLLLAHTKRNF